MAVVQNYHHDNNSVTKMINRLYLIIRFIKYFLPTQTESRVVQVTVPEVSLDQTQRDILSPSVHSVLRRSSVYKVHRFRLKFHS